MVYHPSSTTSNTRNNNIFAQTSTSCQDYNTETPQAYKLSDPDSALAHDTSYPARTLGELLVSRSAVAVAVAGAGAVAVAEIEHV